MDYPTRGCRRYFERTFRMCSTRTTDRRCTTSWCTTTASGTDLQGTQTPSEQFDGAPRRRHVCRPHHQPGLPPCPLRVRVNFPVRVWRGAVAVTVTSPRCPVGCRRCTDRKWPSSSEHHWLMAWMPFESTIYSEGDRQEAVEDHHGLLDEFHQNWVRWCNVYTTWPSLQ